jgi:hypothetical protein
MLITYFLYRKYCEWNVGKASPDVSHMNLQDLRSELYEDSCLLQYDVTQVSVPLPSIISWALEMKAASSPQNESVCIYIYIYIYISRYTDIQHLIYMRMLF